MPIIIPPAMGDAILGTVQALNGGDDEIQIIMVAIKINEAPVIVSSIPPENMYGMLSWLIDHKDSQQTDMHHFIDGVEQTKQ